MTVKKSSLLVIIGILLLSCSSPTSLNSQSEPSLIAQSSENQAQMLPITAKVIIGSETIELEVATTPEQQALGLMYRTDLDENRGMLFPFSTPRYAQFWMKDTLISLDMIFLKDGTVRAIIPNVPPCSADPCPVYGPNLLIDRVIELPSGRATELGIKEGDKIAIEFFEKP